jgi:UDP-N-acetylmuramyl pentapeptide phosphotransferase/UDP-N-acetylglucosamine-1-phosphate transferase
MLLILTGIFLASLVGTRLVLVWLRHRQILDHPNERSSHALPTPRGGGIAVTLVLVGAWAWLGPPGIEMVLGPALFLAALSFADDIRSLSARWRLLAQVVAVAFVLALWPEERGPFFGDLLPHWLDLLAAGLLWVWFVNLYNFMDGIDGITGIETMTIGIGVALVAVLVRLNVEVFFCGAAAAAVAMGFLWWNWHPARVFMGDVGSIPLGFLLGWLLLYLASRGHPVPALILPAYHLADATITLARRASRGEKIWQAHREHFYQRAVRAGRTHASVSLRVLGLGLVLIGLAGWAATGAVWEASGLTLVAVAALLFHLARRAPAV